MVAPGSRGAVVNTADGSYASTTSTVVIVAKSAEVLQPYKDLKVAEDLDTKGLKPWTDDFSNILAAIWRLKVGK